MRAARLIAPLLVLPLASPAFAHNGHGGGLTQGLAHPFTGADHLLAMIAVGLVAGMRGGRAVWALPLAFVSAAAAGFAAGRYGVVLPIVEPMVLASVLLLGLLAMAAAPVGLATGMALVAAFGVFHGQAHAAEAESQAIAGFAAGFLIASAGLHAAGLSLVRLAGARWSRAAGAATLIGGLALAFA